MTDVSETSINSIFKVFEDGTDTGFRNVGQLQFDAGEIPRRKYTNFVLFRFYTFTCIVYWSDNTDGLSNWVNDILAPFFRATCCLSINSSRKIRDDAINQFLFSCTIFFQVFCTEILHTLLFLRNLHKPTPRALPIPFPPYYPNDISWISKKVSVFLSFFLNRKLWYIYEHWNFNSGNYLFTTDTK